MGKTLAQVLSEHEERITDQVYSHIEGGLIQTTTGEPGILIYAPLNNWKWTENQIFRKPTTLSISFSALGSKVVKRDLSSQLAEKSNFLLFGRDRLEFSSQSVYSLSYNSFTTSAEGLTVLEFELWITEPFQWRRDK